MKKTSMKESMNMQRIMKVLALGIVAAFAVSNADAQTGTLQGRHLFLYDGGAGTNLNRISLSTPADASLTANYGLTLPGVVGATNEIMVNQGGGVLGWSSNLTLTGLTVNGPVTLGSGPGDAITINGTMSFPSLLPGGAGLPVQLNGSGQLVALAIDLNNASPDISGVLSVPNGGTGATTFTTNGVLFGNGVSAVGATAAGVAGEVLVGTAGAPAWSNSPTLSGTLTVQGATNLGSGDVGDFVTINTSGTSDLLISEFGFQRSGQIDILPGAGSIVNIDGGLTVGQNVGINGNATLGDAGADQVTINAATVNAANLPTTATTANILVRNGSAIQVSSATFATVGAPFVNNSPVRTNGSGQLITGATDLSTSDVTGTLPVGNGGTGATSLTQYAVLLGNGTGAIQTTAVGATGEILVGNTGANPSWTSTPSFSSLTLTNATNQLVLGTGPNNTTISAPAPAGPRTYTVPDAGANASFVMTEGNQTINGTKTFGGTVNMGGLMPGGANLPLQLDGTGNVVAQAIDLSTGSVDVTGTLPIGNGGTGSTSFTGDRVIVSNNAGTALSALATVNNGMLVTDGTGVPSISTTFPSGVNVPFNQVTSGTSTGTLVVGAGGSLAPSGTGTITANQFASATSVTPQVDLGAIAAEVAGVLPVTNGGTGLNSVATGDILFGSAANTLNTLPIGAPGEYLGITAGLPDWKPLSSDMWVLGGNTAGIIAGNNILGINHAAGVPLRLYVEANEAMRINTNGTIRMENLTPGGVTTVSINGTATQAGANLLNVNNSAGESLIRVDEQVAGEARVQIGSAALDSRVRLFNGAPGGVANLVVAAGLTAARNYTLPVIEAGGQFVVSNGAGTANQILQSNGVGNRASWTGTPTLTNLTLTGDLQVDGNTILGSNNADAVTINGVMSFPGLTAGLPLQTNGSGQVVSELINLTGAADVTGTLPVTNGGTGLATAPVNSILYASAANTYSSLTPGNNQVLTSNGTGVPTWVTGSVVPAGLAANSPVRTDGAGNLTTGSTNLASEVTGTLPIGNGGTGSTSFTGDRVIVSNNAGTALTALATVNNGLLVTNGSGVPSISNTFPSGVTVPFTQVTSGTSTGALLVGTGGSLAPTGTGTITANALSGLGANGIVVRNAAGNFVNRTIVGTAPIGVTNGSGVGGNPTIALTGTVPVANGGTGLTTAPVNSILYASAANTYSSLTPGNNQVLTSNGTGVPTWVTGSVVPAGLAANSPVRTNGSGNLTTGNTNLASEVTGTLPIGNGGTGSTSFTGDRVIVSNNAGTALTALATVNNGLLVTNGSGVPSISNTFPSGVTVPFTQVTSGTSTGTLLVGTGGSLAPTGTGTITANALSGLIGNGVVVQDAAGNFVNRTIVGTAPISVTNGNGVAGDPTIALTGTVPVANGGTGSTSFVGGEIVIANAGGTALVSLPTNTNAVLVTDGLGDPSFSTTLPAAVSVSFTQITAGTNSASLLVGGSLAPTGTGNITANVLNGLVGNGMVVHNAGTFTNRTIVGTAPISVTNGNGVSGNPTIALTGTVSVANGGTGLSSAPINSILYASAANTYSSLAPGANGDVLTVVAGVPTWQTPAGSSFAAITTGINNTATMTVNNGASILVGTAGAVIQANEFRGSGSTSAAVDLATGEVNGVLPVANGGTGLSTVGANGTVLTVVGGAPTWQALDADLDALAALATTGIMVRTGVSTFETKQIAVNAPLSITNANGVAAGNPTISLGTVGVANGGTGLTATPTNGQIPIGDGTGFTLATITGTTNQVTVTNGAGSITLSTPQDIHTGANPTFNNLSLTGTLGVNGNTTLGDAANDIVTNNGRTVLTANTPGVTAPTALGAALPTFGSTWEKVEISDNGTGGIAYVYLPAGTDGQVMYVRFFYNYTAGPNAVIVRQPDNVTNTSIAFAGGADQTIVAHMIYSSNEARWVILSAVNNP